MFETNDSDTRDGGESGEARRAPTTLPPVDTEQRAKIFAALADPTRLRIVELLTAHDELSGSEIAAQTGISLALFCHHSRTLSEAGLISIRREGQTKYNTLNRELLRSCFDSFNGLANCHETRQ
ncbi:MAG TPA: metalloregulator ArsR/SmtB family transcription factor [Chroococcidiopsis sp.]